MGKSKYIIMSVYLIVALSFILLCAGLYGDESREENKERPEYRVVFWNLENYFDPFDDPATSDNEFTPMGERRWSWKKFVKKRNDIAKVIISMGNYPAVVGLAEVENRFVLDQLVRSTPLAMIDYGIIHRDSQDERGIDVALLYRKSLFRPVKVGFITVPLPDTTSKTRLILYTKGVFEDLDTVHLFVNHWPSKFGGETKSQPKREAAAGALGRACDSILDYNSKANIIVFGDFNDTPDSELFGGVSYARGNGSKKDGMEKRVVEDDLVKPERGSGIHALVNLASGLVNRGEGSIKYRAAWELIDMFMVSANLLDSNEPIFCADGAMKIYRPPFLLEDDKSFLGQKPFRCFVGPRYNGGISDHLPIMLTIYKMWANSGK